MKKENTIRDIIDCYPGTLYGLHVVSCNKCKQIKWMFTKSVKIAEKTLKEYKWINDKGTWICGGCHEKTQS